MKYNSVSNIDRNEKIYYESREHENIREGLTCQVEGIVVKMILFLKIVKSNNRMIDM